MTKPIIIIFDYNQVPAGEILFQTNFPGLFEMGYKTYLDEEQQGATLGDKLEVINKILLQAQDLPANDPNAEEKTVGEAKKKTVQLLLAHRCAYVPYDLPGEIFKLLVLQNSDVVNAHPKGRLQGMSDLFAGKIPGREAVGRLRDQLLDKSFTNHAMSAKSGVFCITGVYTAQHLLNYFRVHFPQQDVLSYFAYQGEPFEDFEVIARDPIRYSEVFPYGARLIDMDLEQEQTRTALVDDLRCYHNLQEQLQRIGLESKKTNKSADELKRIQEELLSLKIGFHGLKALNNTDIYLCTIDIYLMQCALDQDNISYVKSSYLPLKLTIDALPHSEIKTELLAMIREILIQIRNATKQSADSEQKAVFFKQEKTEANPPPPSSSNSSCGPLSQSIDKIG